jgi:hypothetical protein
VPRQQLTLIAIGGLLFFPPSGIALIWWGKLWGPQARAVATAASALFFLLVMIAMVSPSKPQRAASPAVAMKPDTRPTMAPPSTGAPTSSNDPPRPGSAAVGAAPEPPVAVNGPTCADVMPNVNRFPGLLPDGVPVAAASHLVVRPRGSSAPIPIVVEGELLFLESLINEHQLAVSRFAGTQRELIRTIQLPRQLPGRDDGLYFLGDFDAAVGEHMIGVAAVVERGGFLLLVDKHTWTIQRTVELSFNSKEGYGLQFPHIAAGGGAFGIAMKGDGTRSWTWDWAIVGEDAKWRVKPQYIKSSYHIWPLVAWTGSSFAVLAGRDGDMNSTSLGVYLMPLDGHGGGTYTPWLEHEGGDFDARILYVGGALRWQDGLLHVAMKSYRSQHTSAKEVAELVHADLEGHVRAEFCPQISLKD